MADLVTSGMGRVAAVRGPALEALAEVDPAAAHLDAGRADVERLWARGVDRVEVAAPGLHDADGTGGQRIATRAAIAAIAVTAAYRQALAR